jgi:hypothetical protein
MREAHKLADKYIGPKERREKNIKKASHALIGPNR